MVRPGIRLDRCHQRADVDLGVVGDHGAEAALYLFEQQPHPVGQDLHLLLLQKHAHHTGLVHGLQVEHPVARFTDSAGDEPIRCSKHVYRAGHHTSSSPHTLP